MLSDPIADMLTRIRNGGQARLARVTIPESRLKREIARVLQENGFIAGFQSGQHPKKPVLTIELGYLEPNVPRIERIERVSRPGRRVYVACREVPRVRHGLGMAILSTPRGVLSDQEARDAQVGGEVLARVW